MVPGGPNPAFLKARFAVDVVTAKGGLDLSGQGVANEKGLYRPLPSQGVAPHVGTWGQIMVLKQSRGLSFCASLFIHVKTSGFGGAIV